MTENNHTLAPRPIGSINWVGFWTLYEKEVFRFIKVYSQTIVAPVITALLFLAVFTLALGRAVADIKGVPFALFLAPGLIMMTMVQNAFANTSSTLMISKIQGNIVDVLMPPLSALEMGLAFALGGVTRGVVVGATVGICMLGFVDLSISHIWAVVYFAFMASLMLSLLGLIGGIWSEKFDHIAAVTNFVVTPLSFLSGTFYAIDRLPGFWHTLSQFNPFFYMIDGFRYGFIGISDANPFIGMAVLGVTDLILLLIAMRMLQSGYKLKA